MFNGAQKPGYPNPQETRSYLGTSPNMVIMNRRPNPTDYTGYEIGWQWTIPISVPPITDFLTGELWILVSKNDGVATWKRLRGSGGGPTPPVSDLMVNKIFLTTPGAGVYTPSADMVNVYVECVGGGGGTAGIVYQDAGTGGSGSDNLSGGGSYTAKLYTSAQIGTSQSYVVGAGGAAGVAPGSPPMGFVIGYGLGGDGGDTTFGVSTTLITAGGGQTSKTSDTGDIGAVGGVASGGSININGYGFAEVNTPNGSVPGSYIIVSASSGYAPMGFSYPLYGSSSYGGTAGSGSYDFYVGKSGSSYPGYGGGCTGSSVTTYGPGAPKGQVNGSSGQSGLIIITEYIG